MKKNNSGGFMKSIKKIFLGISIVFLLTLVINYSWRFIHYYRLEQSSKKRDRFLIAVLIDTRNLVVSGSGLYRISNNEYIYKGQVDNNYLLYSGYLWRIIKVDKDGNVKLITDDIVESEWPIGKYNYEINYDYTNVFKETVKAKVGLLSVSDLFINEYEEYALLTLTNEFDETIFTVFKDGRLYADSIKKPLRIRPSLCLDINLKIVEGNGTIDKPFVLTRG